MRYLALIPAAFFVVGILLAHGSSMTETSAPTPVPAVQGPPDTSGTPLWATSDPEATTETLVESVSGTGGDGGAPAVTATPTSTTVITQALKAQLDERPDPSGEAAGSSPAQGSNEAQVRAAVQALFPPSEWATAMRVSYCESRYEPWAVESSGDHYGTFQVSESIWGPVPSDIYGQVAQAYRVWLAGGWQMWSCQ